LNTDKENLQYHNSIDLNKKMHKSNKRILVRKDMDVNAHARSFDVTFK